MRHRGDRETSSIVQRVNFDGVGLDQLLRRQGVTSDGDGLSRHWVVSAVHRDGGSNRRSASALRRRCVESTVCVGTLSVGYIDGLRRHCVGSASSRRFASAVLCVASRRVASAYIGADDRLTSAAQRFVDFFGTRRVNNVRHRNRDD